MLLRLGRAAVILTAVALLAGCSGSKNVVPALGLAPAGRTALDALNAAHARLGRLELRILIPKRHRIRNAAGRRPAYVSPATRGMTIAITGPSPVTETIGLTPASPGCTGGPSGTTCVLAIAGLRACPVTACYLGSITTYDAVACATTCTIPGGAHALSAAQSVAFTVTTGKANQANFTLGGIPRSFVATPVQRGYLRGDAQGLRLWGPAVEKLSVVALDADGDLIVGPGAPAITAASPSSTLAVVNPVAAAPNTLLLSATTTGSPPVVTPGIVNLSLTATPAAGGGPPISATVTVTIAHGAVYVALAANAVAVYYDGNTTTANLTLAGANTTFSNLAALTVDGSGTLFVTDSRANGALLAFPPGATGNVAPSTMLSGPATAMNHAYGVALSNGIIYITNASSASITEFAQGASGNVAPVNAIFGAATGLSGPEAAALDAAQTLYVANATGVLEFPAGSSGNVTPVTLLGTPAFFFGPSAVALDSNGNLFVTDFTPSVSQFAPGASGFDAPETRITGPATQLSGGLFGLALDLAGSIYATTNTGVAEFAAGATGNVAPIATIASGQAYAVAVVPAPDLSIVTP